MTAPRPTRWSMMRGGTCPLRKPGTVTFLLMDAYAASRLGLSSSNGTSTVSFTRVGFRVSTALFTAVAPQNEGEVMACCARPARESDRPSVPTTPTAEKSSATLEATLTTPQEQPRRLGLEAGDCRRL